MPTATSRPPSRFVLRWLAFMADPSAILPGGQFNNAPLWPRTPPGSGWLHREGNQRLQMAVIHGHRGQHSHRRQIRELDAKVFRHTALVHQLFDVEVVVHRTPRWLTRRFAVYCAYDLFCIMTKCGFRSSFFHQACKRSAAASVSDDFT